MEEPPDAVDGPVLHIIIAVTMGENLFLVHRPLG